ncbi:MAG: hypothetical protein ACI8PT_004304 [Gammaproteobacteria bacterium]|jgi:uncharacterized protein (PEP-CTERM system associated)
MGMAMDMAMTVKISGRVAPTVLGLISSVISVCALAGDWTIVPRVEMKGTYSDNIGLSASGLEREEFVTSVSPGLFVRGEGSRLEFSLEYNLEALRYADDSNSNTINHQAQASATAEVYKDIGFVDFALTRSQQNSNSSGVTSSDNLATTGNSSDVLTFSASPYLRHRFGEYADTESRLTIDRVVNDNNGISTRSDSRTSSLQITSGSHFSRAPWSLNFSNQNIDNSNGSTTQLRSAKSEVRYRVTRQYGALARFGIEKNEFASAQSGRDGVSWSVGGTWTPSVRTSIEAGYGQRFFDQNFFLEATHRTRRFRFAASYSEDVTTSRALQLERVLVPLDDALGNAIVDPTTGTQIEIPVDSVNSTDDVLVVADFSGQITYTGRRTDATLSLTSSERTSEVSQQNNLVNRVQLDIQRRLSRKGTLFVSASAQQTETNAGAQRDTRLRGQVRYSHQFGVNFRGSVGLTRVQQDSTSASNEFDENRLTAGVVATF